MILLFLTSCARPSSSFLERYAVLSVDGLEERQLSGELGRITIIHFWASWCYACAPELERLDRLYRFYRQYGLQVVTVALDSDPSLLRLERTRRSLKLPMFVDRTGAARGRFDVSSVPSSFVLDRFGEPLEISIRGRPPETQLRGPQDWDSYEWQETLRRLLGMHD